jgi:L-gulono-1,4-lactone dehydrogenase
MISNTENVATYGSSWIFQPRHIVDCRNTDDVRCAVLEAVSSGLRVRAMGAGNSWAPHLSTRDVFLKLSGFNRIHSIDPIRKRVIVDPGARLGDVSRALAARGLSLPSLSFFPDVTVGGAVATATHGTSPNWGTLSDFVCSMDVVLASGEVKTFGPESSPEELRAARVAIGMLGVIVRLELQAIAIPWVRFTELNMDLPTFLARLPSILLQYEHVWAHWTLGDDLVKVECLESRDRQADGFHPYNVIWQPSSRVAVRLLNHLGISTSLLLQLRDRYRWAIRPARYRSVSTALDGNLGKVFMSMQYGVPAAQLEKAVDRIRTSDFAASNRGRVVEFKFLKGNDLAYLGPNNGGDAVLFNLWWLVDEASKLTVFDSFEETMRSLHARPHWGKFHRAPDVEYMQKAYPCWSEFESVRSRFDPGQTFSIFHQTEVPVALRSDDTIDHETS